MILQSPWDITLQVLEQLKDGGLRIGVNGYEGQRVVLESTPTLVSSNWQPFATNILSSGSSIALDTPATNSSTRFYRAVTR